MHEGGGNNPQGLDLDSQVMENTEKRVRVAFSGIVGAPAQEVFPLLCPKREEEWIEGWVPGIYKLIFARSGVNEKNCVFQESLTRAFLFGETGPTTWVTTAFDGKNHSLEFLLIFGEAAVLNREVKCTPAGEPGTLCQWTDTVTFLKGPMDEKGRKQFIDKLMAFSSYLGVMLRHFCEKKEMLPLSTFFEGDGPEGLPGDVKANIRKLLSGA